MFCTVPIAIKKPEQGISFSVVLWASYSQNLSATIATNVLRKDLFQRANSFSMSIYLHFRSGRRLNSKRRITAEQLGFRLQGGILAFLSICFDFSSSADATTKDCYHITWFSDSILDKPVTSLSIIS